MLRKQNTDFSPKLNKEMAAKMIEEWKIAYISFCASYAVMLLDTKKKSRGVKFGLGNGCWSGTKEKPIMEF